MPEIETVPLPNPSHQGRGKTFPPLDGGGQVGVLNCYKIGNEV